MNSLNYLSSEAFSSIPKDLVPDLQRMLSANESTRPTAIDFTGKVVRIMGNTSFMYIYASIHAYLYMVCVCVSLYNIYFLLLAYI